MKTFVFNGPTLRPGDIPEGMVELPPAEQGDIAGVALQHPGSTLVLIDGYFRQQLAPWHKEILLAIQRLGCRVIGAGSLGAIRAAELSEYGMEPAGVIAGWYANGTVVDDGEVALLHADASQGYAAISVPLVNLRASRNCSAEMVRALGRIHFSERTPERILGMTGWDMDGYVDQKRADALEALALARKPRPISSHATASNIYSMLMVRMLENDLKGADGKRTHERVPADARCAAGDEELLLVLCGLLGVSVSEQDVREQSTRMWRRLGAEDEAAAAAHMKEHGITDKEWWDRAAAEARMLSLRTWMSSCSEGYDDVPRAVRRRKFYKQQG